MTKNRSQWEILAQILVAVMDKPKTMYGIYSMISPLTSYEVLRPKIKELIEKDMLHKEKDQSGKFVYKTASKGLVLLEKINSLYEVWRDMNE